ncbi:MAG: ATPase central domain protein [Frankiales bacterium]|nr:ATPase central domain protein [Frankiales bacterium]
MGNLLPILVRPPLTGGPGRHYGRVPPLSDPPVDPPLLHLVRQVRAARERRRLPQEVAQRLDAVLDVLERDHSASAEVGGPTERALAGLAEVFRLTDLDLHLLVVASGPDLDVNLGLAFSLLQEDVSRLRPSAGLALELAGAGSLSTTARARLSPAGPLLKHGLVEVLGEAPLLHRGLKVPDRVVAQLLEDATLDPVVAAMVVDVVPVLVPEALGAGRAFAAGVPLVWVRSRPGCSALGLATGVFSSLGLDHLTIDLARRRPATSLESAVRAGVREAALQRAGLVVTGADLLTDEEHRSLLALLEGAPIPVVAVAQRSWDASWLAGLPYCVDAPVTGPAVREALWRDRLGLEAAPERPGWKELVSLRLTPEEIAQTSDYAAVIAAAREEPVSVETAREAARRLSVDMVGTRHAQGAPTFDDLVLPPQVLATLQELVGWAQHRDEVLGQGPLAGKGDKGRGIAALFSGSPGTGKTLAAHVIAAELGLDLHTVELSSIVDKYIGETEKNLERVFDEAESLNVLLFFDEADALFGSRSEVRDARDRYANQEVAYLLQRMEQFNGIAILATNLRGNLDVAFSRRLHFIVHFPDPDVGTRRLLWETHLQAVARRDPDDPVDLDQLAETVELAGGDIRNVVLAAAYAAVAAGAPLGMTHVVRAVVREYRKLGRRLPVPGLSVLD